MCLFSVNCINYSQVITSRNIELIQPYTAAVGAVIGYGPCFNSHEMYNMSSNIVNILFGFIYIYLCMIKGGGGGEDSGKTATSKCKVSEVT